MRPALRLFLHAASLAAVTVIDVPRSLTPVHAHGGLKPLEQWGGFPSSAAHCQRIIARAGARCALRAAQARRHCLNAQMKGLPCDENATTATIAAARREALDMVDVRCSERDTQIIGYLGSFDLQADIIRFCRDWEALATSAAYQPLLPPAPPPDARARRCASTVGGAIQKLASLTFQTWQHALDRLALRPLDVGRKQAAIAAAALRLSAISHRLAVTLAQKCDEASFATLYGRSTEEFASSLMQRASCFAGAFYIQNGTTCPPSICGNRLVEPGEECDDGNDDDSDACTNLCERRL